MKKYILKIVGMLMLLIIALTACSNVRDNNHTDTSESLDNTTETESVEENTTAETPTGYPDQSFCIYGRFLKLKDDQYMIVKYGYSDTAYPATEDEITMQDEGEPILITADKGYFVNFDNSLNTGDAVWAIVSPIQETWPGRTTVYAISAVDATGIKTITSDKIPEVEQELLDRLTEMGYTVNDANANLEW